AVEAPRRECTAALRFQEPPEPDASAGVADEEPPRTAVSLVLICENEPTRRLAIGSEVGACFAIEAGEGSLLLARCWWAGQGALIDVRRDGDVLEVRRADIDEHTGTGSLEPASELPVPENADVRAL
ncbi:MAG: hypothetical protein M3Y87_25955, partial [Myxococcota bacterium]|nr:hypothetical protein [Myxococcota bacterium]